jgi:hypothetical protein
MEDLKDSKTSRNNMAIVQILKAVTKVIGQMSDCVVFEWKVIEN